MPRTKRAPSTAKKADASTIVDKKQDKQVQNAKMRTCVKSLETHLKKMERDLDLECEMVKSAVTMVFRNKECTLLAALRNKTFAELETFSLSSTHFISLSETSSANSVMITSTVQKVQRKKRSLSVADDEGYLTAEGNNDGGKRRSRSTAKKNNASALPASRTTRRSRSLSKSRMQTTNANILKKGYATPANRQPPPDSFGMVTPKMKPNTPQVILRMPREGEMAISMQGSPLLVNPVVSSVPNVSIPLDDGRTISIQPNPLSRLSQVPSMDANTLSRLQVLRDNLIKMCEITK